MRLQVARTVAAAADNSIGVVAVQFCPVMHDFRANVDRVELLYHQALRRFDADVVVFPELALSAYELTPATAAVCASWVDGPQLSPDLAYLQGRAGAAGAALVLGVVERCVECHAYHNAVVYLAPDGEVVVSRKKNLFGPDWLWAKPSPHPHGIFRPRGLAVDMAMVICKDISNRVPKWDPSYDEDEDKLLVGKGEADIVLCSAAWGKGEFPSSAWMEFVHETGAWLVMADRHGQEPNLHFAGGTCIIAPDWTVHAAGLVHSQDSMVFQRIPRPRR